MSITSIIVTSVIIVIVVLVLTLIQVNKAYGYKHSIDPPPIEEEDSKEKSDTK